MKISNITALVLVSLATVGCSEIPAVTSPNASEPVAIDVNAFTVLTDAEVLAREELAAQQAIEEAEMMVLPELSDTVMATIAPDSELQYHLSARITNIEYYGEVGYLFEVTSFAGELHHEDYKIVDYAMVRHDEITDHVTLSTCLGMYVSQCEK